MRFRFTLFAMASALLTCALPTLSAQYAYTANEGDNTISAYKVNRHNGLLTLLADAPSAVAPGPTHITSDPLGRFVYVSSFYGGLISGYTIEKGSGTLTPILGSPFSADPSTTFGAAISPETLAIDPFGRFLYVANAGTHDVAGFKIDPSTGALSPVPNSPFAVNANTLGLAVDPTGRFLYASGFDINSAGYAGTVVGFAINLRNGSLTPVAGSPYTCGSLPNTVAIDPRGRFLYVVNQANISSTGTFSATGSVHAFRMNLLNGSLTPVPGSPFEAGSQPLSMAIDLTGRFAYVANNASDNISAYRIGHLSGALEPLPGSPFAAGNAPYAVGVDPIAERAFVTSSSPGEVHSYTINFFNGALDEVFGSPVPAGFTPQSITITPHRFFW